MARITQEKADNIIKSPMNKDIIQRAILHEERLIFHTEPLDRDTLRNNKGYEGFCEWVKGMLPDDKYKRFLQLLTLPVDTVDSTETIFKELYKIFDAQDKYINYDFTVSDFREDFSDYLGQLKDEEFWKSQAFKAMRIAINSFIICDLPSEQTSERPEPYYYLLSIRNVIDADINCDENSVEWIAFCDNMDRKIVLDDEFYRIYERENQDSEYKFIEAIQHSYYTPSGRFTEGIGYCPAKSFWDTDIYGNKGLNKRGPITDVLGKLDWLLFYRTSKKYLESYTWPIIVSYEEDCNYEDANHNKCHEGFVTTEAKAPDGSVSEVRIPCPNCLNNSYIGPGTEFTVKAPRDKEEHDLLTNPVKVIDMSSDKLKHCVDEIARLEDEIYLSCVGYDGDAMNNEAINEVQVSANFESKENVLLAIKKEFETSIKFATETCAKMRYGKSFLRSEVNLGEEFYLISVDDLTKTFRDNIDSGLPMFFMDKLSEQIRRTKFKNNGDQLRRDDILVQLEPYPGISLTKLQSMGINETDSDNFILKLNFTNFIRRFEREQMNILEFASLIDFGKKITIIKTQLLSYVRESTSTQNDREPTEGTTA